MTPDPDSAASFARRPLAVQVAEAMMRQIARGELTDPLPGEALLAASYGVSRPVLRAALKILAGKGVVEIAQGRRTRLREAGEGRQGGARRLLLVSPGGTSGQGQTGVSDGVRQQLQRKGWLWLEHYDKDLYTRRAPALLEELVMASRPTVLLLLGSTPEMQQWAQERGLPALVLGSLAEGRELPSVDVHYRALGWHAGGRFAAAGVERVYLFARAPLRMGDRATLEGTRAALGERLRVEMLEEEGAIRRFAAILRGEGGKRSGWFFLYPSDAITAYTFLLKERREIPEEVALLCRDRFPLVEAFHPTLAHYETHPAQLVRKAVALLEQLAEGAFPKKKEPVRVMPRFVPGQTLTGS